MDLQIDKASSTVKGLLSSVDKANFLEVIKLVMEIVECEEALKGEQAKQVAVLIITKLVKEAADEDREWLLQVIESGFLEATIDTLIAASKGLYALNKKKCPMKSLFNCSGCAAFQS